MYFVYKYPIEGIPQQTQAILFILCCIFSYFFSFQCIIKCNYDSITKFWMFPFTWKANELQNSQFEIENVKFFFVFVVFLYIFFLYNQQSILLLNLLRTEAWGRGQKHNGKSVHKKRGMTTFHKVIKQRDRKNCYNKSAFFPFLHLNSCCVLVFN